MAVGRFVYSSIIRVIIIITLSFFTLISSIGLSGSEISNTFVDEASATHSGEQLEESPDNQNLLIQKQWSEQFSKINKQFNSQKTSKYNLAKPRYQNTLGFDVLINRFHHYLNQLSSKKNIQLEQLQLLTQHYESVNAANLMFNEHYQIKSKTLQNSNVSGQFQQRLNSSREIYQQKMQNILSQLKPVLSIYQTSEDVKKLILANDFQNSLREAIKNTKDYLDKQKVESAVRILRNNLPYRTAVLARRSPRSSVSVIPSYESNVTPFSGELASTMDAPLTEMILKKAKELEHDYIKIYQFVNNQINTEWYAGARKGAEGTLLQMSGNDVDQASLLIALFRASGLAARYVHGTVEFPVEWINSSLGLVTAEQTIKALNAAGMAYSPIVRGGKIAAIQMEYTWVSAYVPYNNYRGSTVDRSGEQWLPLMPAYKQYKVENSSALLRKAGVNIDSFINNYLASRQMSNLHEQLQETISYFLASNPDESAYQEQLGSIDIKPSQIGLIPNTLPVDVIHVFGEEVELSEEYKQRVRFLVREGVNDNDQLVMEKTIPVSEIANRRLTFSYMPATLDDHTVTNLFGGMDLVPSYLIRLRPQFKLNGRKLFVAEESIATGVAHRLDVEIITPAGSETLKHTLISGSYHAINLATGEASFEPQENDVSDSEYLGAKFLSQVGQLYNQRWTNSENELAKLLNVALIRPFPAFNLVSNDIQVETVLGQPQNLRWKAVTLDAGFRISQPIQRDLPEDNNVYNNAKDFTRLSALQGSTLEHEIFEDLFKAESISADKGIQEANASGQNILTINAGNFTTQAALLSEHPQAVVTDVQNWVTKGYQVTIPQNLVSLNDWQGSVWQVVNLNDGSSGYFIAGGLAGGSTTQAAANWVLDWLQAALDAINTPPPNETSSSVASIVKYNDPGFLKGIVGRELGQELIVQVKDEKGLPVQGAVVSFIATNGQLSEETVITDYFGLARVRYTQGESTNVNPIYQRQNPSDQYLSKASLSGVIAYVDADIGRVALEVPFYIVSFADQAVSLISIGEISLVALPGTTDDIFIKAVDQFNNTVSNVDVQASIESNVDTDCVAKWLEDAGRLGADYDEVQEILLSAYGNLSDVREPASLSITADGSRQTSVDLKTAVVPVAVLVHFGDVISADYPLSISGAGATLNYPFKGGNSSCYPIAGITANKSSGLASDSGKSAVAGKPGETLEAPFSIKAQAVYSSIEHPSLIDSEPLDLTNTSATFSPNGGAVSGAVYYKEGRFTSDITLGPAPAEYEIEYNLTVLGDGETDGIYLPFSEILPGLFSEFFVLEVNKTEPAVFYAVVANIGAMTSQGLPGIPLTPNFRTEQQSRIQYSILPGSYEALIASVDILENGAIYQSFIGSSLSAEGSINLPAGIFFDPNNSYAAQLVLNRGTQYEIKSDPQPLNFRKDIILNHSARLNISQDIDVINNKSCFIAGDYQFELSEEATVTLEAGSKRLIDQVVYPAGRHNFLIAPSELSSGIYLSKITAVATSNSESEEKTGEINVSLISRNNLPVGHTLVKGVDVFNGNLSVSSTDFSFAARHLPLEFQRYYSSNNSGQLGSLGVGWNHNYNSSLSITLCGDIVINGSSGGGHRFAPDADGKLVALKGYHGTLIPNEEDRTFDFYTKDGTRYHYKNYGRKDWDLEYIEDINGNKTLFTYEDSATRKAKLIAVSGPGGRTITFDYQSKRFLSQPNVEEVLAKVSFNGVSVSFSYDDYGNLIEASRSGGRVEKYTYATDTGNPVSRYKLTSYTDANGQVYSYSYQEQPQNYFVDATNTAFVTIPFANVLSIEEPEVGTTNFSYNSANRQTTVTNPRGFSTQYTCNELGSVINTQKPIGSTSNTWADDDVLMTSSTDANGNQTNYEYDTFGNQTRELMPQDIQISTTYYPPTAFSAGNGQAVKNRVRSVTDGNGNLTQFEYDAKGNLTKVINPDGGEISHSYKSNGDKLSTTDANGNITFFRYDDFGNLIQLENALGHITKTERNNLGLPIKVIDARGNSLTNSYDGLQRLISSTNALGGVKTYTYDANGNKLTDTDENGNTMTYIYDGANRVISVTNADNKQQTISYDENNNKISETDFNGNVTSYQYDANDRLSRTLQPENRQISSTYDLVGNKLSETVEATIADPDVRSQTTSFVYDELNRTTQITAPLGLITSMTYDKNSNLISRQVDGISYAYQYDSMNRLIRQIEPLGRITQIGYDFNGNKTQETDARENSRSFKYDKLNRLTAVTDGNGDITTNIYDEHNLLGLNTSIVDARLNATQFDYDKLNRRIETIDATGASTKFAYDNVGNRTQITMANGNLVMNTYDSLNRLLTSQDSLGSLFTGTYDNNGNLLTETDANGNITTNTYDGLNRVIQRVLPENRRLLISYDIHNNKISSTDARGFVMRYEYDDLNRLLRSTDPLNGSLQATYDLRGNKLTETDKRGNTTRYEYDDLNQLIRMTDPLDQTIITTYDPVGNQQTQTDKRGIKSSFTYDKENRLLTTTKSGLKLLTIEYDAVGNKAFETDANGNITAYIYSKRNELIEQSQPLAAITRFTYDAMGNQASITDPENRVTSYSYDLRNRRLTETTPVGTTIYGYDANGNQTGMTKPQGNAWNYTYDTADRLTSIVAPDTGETQYSYDANNNRITQTDALGNVSRFEFDALNRRTRMIYADDVAVLTAYDENGNLTQMTDANGKVFNHTYDVLNRKTNTTYPAANTPTANDIINMDFTYDENNNLTSVVETFNGGRTRTTLNNYDSFDRVVSTTNGDNKTIQYTFDANGNRTSVTDADGIITTYRYDKLNRAIQVINQQGITSYVYDRSSRQTQVNYPNGTQAVTGYDAAGRTQSINNLQAGSTISRFDYLLDANGNRIQQTETQGATQEVIDYTYDANDRLTEEQISVASVVNETTNYTYDVAYNRLTEVKVQGSGASAQTLVDKAYSYNNRNQTTQVTDNLLAANSATYSYDNNGNRIQKQTSTQTENYIYDVRDQLKEIQQGGSTIGQFLYDYQGLRVEKITSDNGASTTRKYVYDDQSVLQQTDASGNTLSKYDYGTNRLLSLTHATEGAQFYLFDALGSPVNLTTTAGVVQARYQYDAFGNQRSQVGSSANVFGFTGHEKDEETGLYYFKARYYDPTLGQFLTQDAFEGLEDTPPSLHKYIYAYGNPTVYWDPDGNMTTRAEREAADKAAYEARQKAELKEQEQIQTGVSQAIENFNKMNEECLKSGQCVNEEEYYKLYPEKKVQETVITESDKSQSSVVDFIEEYNRARRQYADQIKAKAAIPGQIFDVVSGMANPIKGMHDLVTTIDDAPQMISDMIDVAWDNPEYTALTLAAIAACKAKCGDIKEKIGEFVKNKNKSNKSQNPGIEDAEAGDLVKRNDGNTFDLDSHEGYKPTRSRSEGHLIKKHINQTDKQLIARANGLNAPRGGVSSFSSKEAAEHFVDLTIKDNKENIRRWLNSNPGNKPEAFSSKFDTSTGRHVRMHSDSVSNVNGVKIILQRDPSRPEGYRILTGHPSIGD